MNTLGVFDFTISNGLITVKSRDAEVTEISSSMGK